MNVRELKMAVSRAASLGQPVVHFAQLSRVLELEPDVAAPLSSRPRRDAERPSQAEIEDAFAAEGGVVTRVAERFGKDPRQIYRWLRHYGIDAERFR